MACPSFGELIPIVALTATSLCVQMAEKEAARRAAAAAKQREREEAAARQKALEAANAAAKLQRKQQQQQALQAAKQDVSMGCLASMKPPAGRRTYLAAGWLAAVAGMQATSHCAVAVSILCILEPIATISIAATQLYVTPLSIGALLPFCMLAVGFLAATEV